MSADTTSNVFKAELDEAVVAMHAAVDEVATKLVKFLEVHTAEVEARLAEVTPPAPGLAPAPPAPEVPAEPVAPAAPAEVTPPADSTSTSQTSSSSK